MHRGIALRIYLGLSYLFPMVARPILRRRLARGKEDPKRWMEKCGMDLASRPQGTVIWLHAVGLGEVLSLRGLINRLGTQRPDLSFLVTSTTRASAEVFAKNMPPRTVHQFLPIDAPRFRRRFLDHFQPDLCVWVEQDLWPGFVSDIAARGIPQCIIAARMNATSAKSHQRARSLYRDLYQAMAIVTAQDADTALHLNQLGAKTDVTGSLKPAAPALAADAAAISQLKAKTAGRFVWAAAPAHPDDIAIALAAHQVLRSTDPTALLIIAPRFPESLIELPGPRWSNAKMPEASDPVWLCDTLGDLGLVYGAAKAVLIGGTFADVEGHNPWEAAVLGCATLHGPRTANFRADFAMLDDADASISVVNGDDIAAALTATDLAKIAQNADACVNAASLRTDALATRLINLLDSPDGR